MRLLFWASLYFVEENVLGVKRVKRGHCMVVRCHCRVCIVSSTLVATAFEKSASFCGTSIALLNSSIGVQHEKYFHQQNQRQEIIDNCQLYFGLQPVAEAIKKRKINLLN